MLTYTNGTQGKALQNLYILQGYDSIDWGTLMTQFAFLTGNTFGLQQFISCVTVRNFIIEQNDVISYSRTRYGYLEN